MHVRSKQRIGMICDMKPLGKRAVRSFLKAHEGWKLNVKETELILDLSFPQYVDGLIFIARVAVHAEILKHHPQVNFTKERIKIKISTRGASGLTKADIALATRIDKLLEKK